MTCNTLYSDGTGISGHSPTPRRESIESLAKHIRLLVLDVDGVMGQVTRKAMQQADTDKILMAMIDQREAFYQRIVNKDESQEVFLHGWLNRVDDLRNYVRGL